MSLGTRRTCQQGECRPGHEKLAQSVHCLIEHSEGGKEPLVKLAGKLAGEREIHYSKNALYQFGNLYQEDHSVRVPLCVVDALESLYESTIVTEAMALRRGGVFVPLEKVDAGISTDLQQQKRAIKEFAEAIQFDSPDHNARVREIEEAIRALLVMRETEKARAIEVLQRPRPQIVGAR